MSGNVVLGQPLAGTLIAERQKSKRRWQKNLAGYAFIAPWLIGFFAFTLIPVVSSLVLAFTNFDNMSPPQWVGLANFQQMFTRDFRYWKSVQATFFYVFTAVPIRLVVALAVAMLLNTNRKGVSFYRAAFYAPSIVGGSVAVAIMWRELFDSEGAINAITAILGFPPVNWLGNPQTAIWTLIALAAWQFGSPMLIFLAGLKQIPSELYEAASIDGASAVQRFVRITIPMLSPVIFFNLIMQVISGFLVFTQAYIITGGQPLDTTLFYALYLYRRAFETFQMGYGAAMAWVLLLVIAFFTILIFRSSARWVFYETKDGE
jgi:multiple sugar transport system permease protein